jgi:hypothetical protein
VAERHRSRTDDGSRAAVDTDLEHHGTALEPANTNADPRISQTATAADPPHAGVSFRVAAAAPVSARVVDDKALYPNVTIAAPVAQ